MDENIYMRKLLKWKKLWDEFVRCPSFINHGLMYAYIHTICVRRYGQHIMCVLFVQSDRAALSWIIFFDFLSDLTVRLFVHTVCSCCAVIKWTFSTPFYACSISVHLWNSCACNKWYPNIWRVRLSQPLVEMIVIKGEQEFHFENLRWIINICMYCV